MLAFLPDETLRAELHTSWAAKGQADDPEVNVLRWQQLEQELAKVPLAAEAACILAVALLFALLLLLR